MMKKIVISFFAILLTLLAACKAPKPEKQPQNFINLNESTELIMSVLKSSDATKFFDEILEDSDANPLQFDILIKNFSPSEIAFETEVLSFGKPVVVLFYAPDDQDNRKVTRNLEIFAMQHPSIKCVIIDAYTLWKITKQVEVEQLPSLSIFNNREEIFFADDLQHWPYMEKAILSRQHEKFLFSAK